MTSSSSPGSLLYGGNDVTDIWEGVRRGLRGLRAVRRAVPFAGRFSPLIVPASCSAVSSRATPPTTGAPGTEALANEKKRPELRKDRFVQIMRATQNKTTKTTRTGI